MYIIVAKANKSKYFRALDIYKINYRFSFYAVVCRLCYGVNSITC